MEDYQWMVGSWLAHGMEYIEEWSIINDSTMTARVYREEGTDTIVSEQIVFSERNGNFVYTPTVKSQNSGQPINFEATVMTPNELQFENMAHDFPNRIVYFRTSDQQMDVRIEAVANGQVMKSYDILMSRLK
jgi:hypothetical protein